MPAPRSVVLASVLLLALGGCAAAGRGGSPDDPELATLYEQDQADRRGTDWTGVDRRDAERRQRAREILDAGRARTGADFYHAAMVFQHGSDSADFRRAHELASRAERMGHAPARWLAAASLDRWLLSTGQPQRYGTQFNEVDGRTWLSPMDTLALTDAERSRAGARTLDQTRAYLARVNGTAEGSLEPMPAQPERERPGVALVGTLDELARQVRYPDAARAAGVAGRIRIQLTVQPDGTVGEAFVVDGLGHGLDEEALRVIRGARFTNASGEPHEIRVALPVAP
jgi:TonB family protein